MRRGLRTHVHTSQINAVKYKEDADETSVLILSEARLMRQLQDAERNPVAKMSSPTCSAGEVYRLPWCEIHQKNRATTPTAAAAG